MRIPFFESSATDWGGTRSCFLLTDGWVRGSSSGVKDWSGSASIGLLIGLFGGWSVVGTVGGGVQGSSTDIFGGILAFIMSSGVLFGLSVTIVSMMVGCSSSSSLSSLGAGCWFDSSNSVIKLEWVGLGVGVSTVFGEVRVSSLGVGG